ncbi:hypothetical protein JNUCC64_12940 [Streptomyces sp. JNUCC 64]
MREMSEDAREVLVLAVEVARLRDAPVCTSRDVALAVIAYRLMLAEREPEVLLPSLSPEALPLDLSLEELLSGTPGAVPLSELRELALRENPDFAEYLGASGEDS